MQRRTFLAGGLTVAMARPLMAALQAKQLDANRLEEAADVLKQATSKGPIATAVLHVRQYHRGANANSQFIFNRAFGKQADENAMFLLGSISKPICMTALMTLFDRGEFKLDDPVKKFIPKFTGEGRDAVTMQHLLTHVSGLPDQVAENHKLRSGHAPLSEFVAHTIRTPLEFKPGSQYQYSSMGIMLAAHVAEIISRTDILTLVDRAVFQPLAMKHSAQGLGRFKQKDLVPVQTEFGAPESGGGDPKAKDWDWNSAYWRKLGAPWGGTHASAPDIGSFLAEFLLEKGAVVKPATARLMVTNHNAADQTPRGLGFAVGKPIASPGCSEKTFGHGGSTGTIAWADPASKTICVVLTSLPGRALKPHPREVAATKVAAAAG